MSFILIHFKIIQLELTSSLNINFSIFLSKMSSNICNRLITIQTTILKLYLRNWKALRSNMTTTLKQEMRSLFLTQGRHDSLPCFFLFIVSRLFYYMNIMKMSKISLLREYIFLLIMHYYMFWALPLLLDLFNEVGLVKADSDENFAAHSKFTILW